MKFTKLWNSPTLTTWGVQITQILQVVLLTPLLLRNYNEVEVAAWYLFSSFNIFGQIILQRVNLSFSRMIAFAMAGAKDLSPVSRVGVIRGQGEPNWPVIGQVLGTMTTIQWGLVWFGALAALAMGGSSLNGLLDDYAQPNDIWLAFVVFQSSSFFQFFLYRHGATLTGMNQVAANNKRGMGFALLSSVLGIGAIACNMPIYMVVAVVQLSLILNGVVASRMVSRILRANAVAIDRKFNARIAKWAWAPTWRGVIGQIASMGVLPFLSAMLAKNGNVAEAATFAFSIRMVAMLENGSMAPYSSQLPLISRLAVQGELDKMREIIFKRMKVATALLVGSLSFAWIAFDALIPLVNGSIEPPSASLWYGLAAYVVVGRFFSVCLSICAVMNNIILSFESLLMSLGSMIFVACCVDRLPLLLMIGGIALMQVAFVGLKAPLCAARQIGTGVSVLYKRIGLPHIVCALVFSIFAIYN